MEYEVIIVGGGPAGIFAALTLCKLGVDDVLLIEQGKDLQERERAESKDILRGWGGAGAYSDGKLTISTDVGGHLGEFLNQKTLHELLVSADKMYVEYGAPDRVFGDISPEVEELADRARQADLEFLPTRIRHIGTDNCRNVLANMYDTLSGRILIRTNCAVKSLVVDNNEIVGVTLENGEILRSRYVIVAPGRSEVISLAPEYITPQDGHEKQDCERMAAKRWVEQQADHFTPYSVTLLGHNLYCNQPLCQLILEKKFNFIFVCKPDSHQILYESSLDFSICALPKPDGVDTDSYQVKQKEQRRNLFPAPNYSLTKSFTFIWRGVGQYFRREIELENEFRRLRRKISTSRSNQEVEATTVIDPTSRD